uniref:Uncharacterized protein n=1 Tax=Arundo donax TaxID=35708 RepID=A0A0A9HP11_ARUDO
MVRCTVQFYLELACCRIGWSVVTISLVYNHIRCHGTGDDESLTIEAYLVSISVKRLREH